MMKLLMLAIALGLASADGGSRIRKQLPSHERLQVDAEFFDAVDIAPLFDSLEDFGPRYLMDSMSMSTSTSTTASADPYSSSTGVGSSSSTGTASLGLSGISVADLETEKEESPPVRTPVEDSKPPFLPPVKPTTTDKETAKDEVVVVDIGSDGSDPSKQNAGGLKAASSTSSKVAPGSAASSSVNVGGVVGSTLACLAALAGAALLIYKRRQGERIDLPMTN